MNIKHDILISKLIHVNIVTSPLHQHYHVRFILPGNIVKALCVCGVNSTLTQLFSWLSTKNGVEKEQVNLLSTSKMFARYWWNTSGHYVLFKVTTPLLWVHIKFIRNA